MSRREDILNKIATICQNISSLKKVTRQYQPYELYRSMELPVLCVLNGNETRHYEGQRVIAEFDVVLRLIIYDEKDLTTELNQLVNDITSELEQNPYLDGESDFPIQILSIETSQGWLSPYEISDITVRTFYSKCLTNYV